MRRLGLLALLVIAAIGAGAGWLDSQISRPYRGHRPEKVFVDIPHGKSRWSIAGILRQDDVIRNRLAFALFSFWHIRTPMEAGEYYFDHPVTSREVFWQIAQGRIFVHTVTIPEGWTMFDIAAELDRQGVCSREDFLEAAKDTSADFRFCAASAEPGGISLSLHLRIHAPHHLRTGGEAHGPEFSRRLGVSESHRRHKSSRTASLPTRW